MPTPPLRPAPERFVGILRALAAAVVKQTGWGLSFHLIAVIVSRIQRIRKRFSVLAARIAVGTYKPRPPAAAPRRTPETSPKPPPPNPLPNTQGWLLPLETSAAGYRGQIEALLQDAEMLALMAAAPEAMARALRPLCRMLGLDLPPALATRRRVKAKMPPDPARAAPAAKPRPPRLRPPRAPPPLARVVPAPPPLTLAFPFGRPQLIWT